MFFHAENTADASTQLNVIGSNPSGTGVLLDGTSSTTNCIQNQISNSSFTDFLTAVVITGNCSQTSITSPTYSFGPTSPSIAISDSGVATQTTGAPVLVPNMTFGGAGTSMVQYFTATTGAIANMGDLVCFTTTATEAVGDCGTNATNFVGVALGTSSAIPVQVGGTATINLDSTPSSLAAGHYVCSSATVGLGTYQAVCSAGHQVGIVAQTVALNTAATALIFLQKN